MMDDFLEIFLPVIGIIVVITTPLVFIAIWLDSASCGAQSSAMGLKSTYGPLQGCMVYVDDRWEPLSWQKSVRIKKP